MSPDGERRMGPRVAAKMDRSYRSLCFKPMDPGGDSDCELAANEYFCEYFEDPSYVGEFDEEAGVCCSSHTNRLGRRTDC